VGLNYEAATEALRGHLAAAGLPAMGYHAFRHGAGTAWAAVDAPLLAIKQQLRHRTARTTEGYVRPVSEGARHAERVAERVRLAE
jgi:integrase